MGLTRFASHHKIPAPGGSIVRKGVPVDVSDVACAASAHEANRNDGSVLLVEIEVLALSQRPSMDEQARSDRRPV